jgi:uncharacterized SAM-binding protein YcdF (DUF218 family)
VLAAIGLLALVTGAGLLTVALFPSVLRIPVAMLIDRDEAAPADLIVVLSPNTPARALGARDLYARGFARKVLLIPEPPGPLRRELEELGFKFESSRYSGSHRILMASKVPLSDIDQLPTHAENTKGEALLVGAYAREHRAESVLLVTSPISSRRACWVFKRTLPSVRIVCQPTTYDRIEYDRKVILWVVNEYLKLAANVVGIN